MYLAVRWEAILSYNTRQHEASSRGGAQQLLSVCPSLAEVSVAASRTTRQSSMDQRFVACKVRKLNHRKAWDRRWIALDGAFGVLLVYRKRIDFERKTPAHIFLMSEVATACAHELSGVRHCIMMEFNKHADVGIPPRPQIYSCEKQAIVDQWVALISKMSEGATRGGAIARGLRVTTSEFQLGVTLRNIANQPLGVEIATLDASSPLEAHGLKIGDAILAVNGTCCLSHSHAEQLVDMAARGEHIDLIVWSQSMANRALDCESSAVDIS